MTDFVVARAQNGFTAEWGRGPRRCSAGKGGVAEKLREGDGITPIGTWPLRNVLYRPDRRRAPRTLLPISALTPQDGWCEDPRHADYNRMVRLPHPSATDSLWREDALYDVVLVVGYNDAPVIPGKGSAIFIHIARENYGPTQGCVGLARADLEDALAVLTPDSRLIVRP